MHSEERTPLACWQSHSAIAHFSPIRTILNAAKCGDQHARGVRSPERRLRGLELNGSFAAHENLASTDSRTRHVGARANAISKAAVHVRRHDETEARRRASAVTR